MCSIWERSVWDFFFFCKLLTHVHIILCLSVNWLPCGKNDMLSLDEETTSFFLKYSWFIIFCQFLLYSKVTQSYIYIHSFFHTIFHHVLTQEIGHSSLCCTVGPYCFSVLKVIAHIYQPQTPSPSHSFPSPLPLGNRKSLLQVYDSISVW